MGRGAPAARRPWSLGGPRFVVALEGDATWAARKEFAAHLRQSLAELSAGGVEIECVRAEELADPEGESDLYFGEWRPAVAGSRRVCSTLSLEEFEQAPDGLVWRRRWRQGGTPECVYPYPPLALVTMPGFRRVEKPEVGHDHALLFVSPPLADGRIPSRVTGLPDVVAAFDRFRTLIEVDGPLPLDRETWIRAAEQVLGAKRPSSS